MPIDAETTAVQDRYRRFAVDEAPHRSALYAEWAARVASDTVVAAVLAGIPPAHRQPPLVFAVCRMLGCGLQPAHEWASWLGAHADAVVTAAAERGVQTNEPLRCAALLPALSSIEGPIALLEVGASAGLCLYPDRYSYRYRTAAGVVAIDPAEGVSPVVLHAEWRGPAPRLRTPEIVWRAGIDLQPRNAADAADRAWLTGLVWPGETGREDRVRAALDIVAADPPLVVAGDAAEMLPGVAAQAPTGATLVVTTPGVLAHVPRAGRERIIRAASRADHWITMDAPGLHSLVIGEWGVAGERGVAAERVVSGERVVLGERDADGERWVVGERAAQHETHPDPWPNGTFALAVDGRVVAAVDPLGGIVEPIGERREWHPLEAPVRG